MVSSSQSTLKIAGAHDFLVDRTLSLFVCVFSSSSHTRLQTDITVEFTPAEGCTQYELSWKEYPAPWGAATGSTMVTAATGSTNESRRLLKSLVNVIQDCEYTDPIVEFVNCLCVKFDFDAAQVKLAECESVMQTDFFLCQQTKLFMEEARVFVFENYCRIHNKIDLRTLGEKLAMDEEQAERWIVDLIRNADLDAKIDAAQGCVVMGDATQSIYEQVMDRTRELNVRSASLAQNLNAVLTEARKEKAKKEKAARENDEY